MFVEGFVQTKVSFTTAEKKEFLNEYNHAGPYLSTIFKSGTVFWMDLSRLGNPYASLFLWRDSAQKILWYFCHENHLKFFDSDSDDIVEIQKLLSPSRCMLVKVETLEQSLEKRLKIFGNLPTSMNTMLLFQVMENKIVQEYKRGHIFTEKEVERFDKLKSLALKTNQIHERRLAAEKAVEKFHLMLQEKE